MRGACARVAQHNQRLLVQPLGSNGAAIQQGVNQPQHGVEACHGGEEGGTLPEAQPVDAGAVAAQQAQPGAPLQKLFAFDGAASVAPGASALLHFSPTPALVARVAADGERALHAERLRVSIGMPGLVMLEGSLDVLAPDGPVLLARAPFAAAAAGGRVSVE